VFADLGATLALALIKSVEREECCICGAHGSGNAVFHLLAVARRKVARIFPLIPLSAANPPELARLMYDAANVRTTPVAPVGARPVVHDIGYRDLLKPSVPAVRCRFAEAR